MECKHGTILYGNECLNCTRESSGIITAEGQLKEGDQIVITGKSDRDSQKTTVKEVLTVNGDEEILIDTTRNRYFITKLVVAGSSWAKEVRKIQDGN